MKILSVDQLRLADKYTIEEQNISSWELMERAATAVFDYLKRKFPSKHTYHVFCGPGNNGGDGLAIARMLYESGDRVLIYMTELPEKFSPDTTLNFFRIPDELCPVFLTEKPKLITHQTDIVLDALFGFGLNRSLDAKYSTIVKKLNALPNYKISIDVPSGMFVDTNNVPEDIVFQSDLILTFETPKLSFLLASNAKRFADVEILPISLSESYLQEIETPHHVVDLEFAQSLYRTRNKFGHKGLYGHLTIVGGSKGKIGAVSLATKAALKSGVGLVTANVPACGYDILQTSVPEAMCLCDENSEEITQIQFPEKTNVIALGPGLGTSLATENAVLEFFKTNTLPLVLDADCLNILAKNKEIITKLPKNTILTPHLGEFTRLFGDFDSEIDRFNFMKSFSVKNKLIICLKGHHTVISTPENKLYFNSSGNVGMATGGSGDVLTGIIGSLLAQNYDATHAAILGVYLHGFAGDLALENESEESLIASDLIKNIGSAFKSIKKRSPKTSLSLY